MLDIAFHIAVLIVVVFGVGIFAFKTSLYDYLLGSMKNAIKEKTVNIAKVSGNSIRQPAKLIKRRESDIEKAIKEGIKGPIDTTIASANK